MTGETVVRPRSGPGSELVDRVAAAIRRRGVQIALWTAAAVAEVAVFAPLVVRGGPVGPVESSSAWSAGRSPPVD